MKCKLTNSSGTNQRKKITGCERKYVHLQFAIALKDFDHMQIFLIC